MAKISKNDQAQKTQRALLDVARELFTKHGYANTSTEEVVRRSKVTRGALYYHYRDKAALFEAVFQEVRADSGRFIREKMQAAQDDGADSWQQVIAGCHAFVESSANPSMQRIVHTDGPAVLGRNTVQKGSPGLKFLQNVFERLMAEGTIEKIPLDPLTHILWGTFFEAGVYIAHADDIDAAQEEMASVLLRVLTGLRPTALVLAPAENELSVTL